MRLISRLRFAFLLFAFVLPMPVLPQTNLSDPGQNSPPKRCEGVSRSFTEDSAADTTPAKIIIDSVDFDDASELPPVERDGLVSAIKQLADDSSGLSQATVRLSVRPNRQLRLRRFQHPRNTLLRCENKA
jgi:hypothetical protein